MINEDMTMTDMLSQTNVTMGRQGETGFFARLQKSFADYRLYRKTLGELEGLNNRELADLGLSRFDLRKVAYDSIYGA